LALKMILKGMSLRGGAEVLGVKLYTVRIWLRKAAEHSGEVKVLIKDINGVRRDTDLLLKKQFRKWGMDQKTKDGPA